MNTRPLISVCINCYNAKDTIAATIRSVLEQTYTNLQVIVVDDCSTDGTWDYLQTITDPRVECHRLAQNGHISNANNEALRRVRGDFVAHLDADDVWYPDKLERQLTFLQEHEEYGACFTLAEMVDEQGNPVEDHRFRAENRNRAELLHHFLTVGNYLCHSSMLARREIIDQVGEHDVTLLYFHDFDYWIRMAMICEIYILPDKLLDYRLSANSNSAMTEQKMTVHIYESARIAYQSVRQCPDELFLEAFADRLRLQGAHTPEQTELEKAFILADLIVCLPQNRAMELRRLSELLSDERYAAVAKRDFGFTVHDLYKLEENIVFHNAVTHQALVDHAAQLENNHQSLHDAYQTLMQHADALMADRDRLQTHADAVTADRDRLQAHADAVTADRDDLRRRFTDLAAQLSQQEARAVSAEQHIALMQGSISWKLTKPLRAIRLIQSIERAARKPHTRDGRAAACKIMLYGFFGHNLGDDLFFDRLFARYPDTVFVAFDAVGYEAVFAKYPNVYVYQRNDPRGAQIDRLGAKLGRQEAFEKLLLSKTDAVVHIGGSIYQQIGAWEQDLRLRDKRYKRSHPFFSISSNFGPFHTDSYRTFWHKRFAISRDICFRDTYSQSLFVDLPAVRYAPDLLFSHSLPAVDTVSGRLFISVIDPAHVSHTFSEEQCRGYIDTMSAVTEQWLRNGRSVVLSSFCAFENDPAAVDAIIRAVPAELHGGLSVASYDGSGDTTPVLSALAASEYVISTRFHATLFGMSAGKTVLPICYNPKVTHMLEDIGFDGHVLDMDRFAHMGADAVIEALTTQSPFDVRAQQEQALSQFDRLDAYIRRKGGTVAD